MSFIVVRHNIEVAHRLFALEGNKCQNIHGHSMWVEMKLHGHLNAHGILEGLDFGTVKKHFREFLDTNYDHHLLLNENDPWARGLYYYDARYDGRPLEEEDFERLPGLITTSGDPTTENLAKWIANWATRTFHLNVDVHVQETHVNGAGHSEKHNGS